jgi:hypothetical protein
VHDAAPARGGDRGGGLGSTLQVTAVDGGDVLVGERRRELRRLPAAVGIERDVELALDALLDVPVGLAVADDDETGGFGDQRPASRGLSV